MASGTRQMVALFTLLCVIICGAVLWSNNSFPFDWSTRAYGFGRGPLYAGNIEDPFGWVRTGSMRKPGSPIIVGGYPVSNHTVLPITIVDVKPTNVPDGLQVVKTGLTRSPIGALDYNDDTARQYPLVPMPFVLYRDAKSQDPASQSYVQPVIAVQATKPGVFVIQGLLVTYLWHGHRFTDYFPDQIVICSDSACPPSDQIPPPPRQWP
jgi:hypothetical protein